MSATALVAELLIAGLQFAIGLGLLLLFAAGPPELDKDTADNIKASVGLVTIILLGAAYTVGIIIDRLADVLDDRIPWKAKYEGPGKLREDRLFVMFKSSEVTKFLEYQRSRLRIARCTTLNLLLFLLGLVALVFGLFGGLRPGIPGFLILVIVAVVFAFALYSWVRLDGTYVKSLADAREVVTPKETAAQGAQP